MSLLSNVLKESYEKTLKEGFDLAVELTNQLEDIRRIPVEQTTEEDLSKLLNGTSRLMALTAFVAACRTGCCSKELENG